MPAQIDPQRNEIRALLAAALENGTPDGLAAYLVAHSGLPGPRMNLALAGAFADQIGATVTAPAPPVARIEALLDGWAALPPTEVPANDPRVILPAVAVLSYGQVAVSRPDWWADEIAKLHRAAADPRWRIGEMVATALQRMLAADWTRTLAALVAWTADPDPRVVRAAAAAVAEPPLLKDPARGTDALAVQEAAVAWLARCPLGDRRADGVRTLRQALGYTLSVATAAAPEPGMALLRRLAAGDDADLRWVARENAKKRRLAPWAGQLFDGEGTHL